MSSSSSSATTTSAAIEPIGDQRDLLPIYYSRLFPINLMYRWLSYGKPETFSHREFSFTLAGDVYIRYQSFNNEEEFLKSLKLKAPEKIDIGAVYNQKPKHRTMTGEFQPEEKEFVLDIDLTDYDDIRTCCSGATVCGKCWKFIGVAVTILDAALRDDFGFRQLLWVFSGRRGVHCWVCDEVARKLDTSGRAAVAEYLQLIRGGENQAKKISLPYEKMHPSIRRAAEIIEKYFETICIEEQSMFDQDKNLEILPQDLKKKALSSKNRWQTIDAYIRNDKDKTQINLRKEIGIQLCYPRLDVHVSKGMNHLLKSPFCVHPKTGQVCVPFDPKKVFDFKISEVPRIEALIEEIGARDKENPNNIGQSSFKKTSLVSFMSIFEEFVKGLEKKRRIAEAKSSVNEDTNMEF